MPRVVHFDIQADDVDRAIDFYSSTFGWTIEPWESDEMAYWMVMTGDEDEPGIDGGLTERQGERPDGAAANGFVCAIDVEDIEASVDAVEANGGVVTTEVMSVGDMGKLAYCLDTKGNQFSLWQELGGQSA